MPLPQGKVLSCPDTQAAVADRFEKAMEELYIKGQRQKQEKARQEEEQRLEEAKEALDAPRKQRLAYAKDMHGGGSISAAEKEQLDEDESRILDEDPDLDRLRQARIERLKQEKNQRLENLAKGHGTYEEIVEDEFLKVVLASKFVICHFYHKDFERCKVMDKHLKILAEKHVETKFVKINAEKTPFFVDKLSIRVLPSVVVFADGKSVDTLVGFQGLEGDDDFDTRSLEERVGITGAIKMERAFYEADYEREKQTKARSTQRIFSFERRRNNNDSDDDPFAD